MKAVLYRVRNKPVLLLIRGDRDIDENKLEALFGTDEFRLAEAQEVRELLGTEKGFIGIFNLPEGVEVFWDNSLYGVRNLVVALNEPGWHYVNVNPERDFSYGTFVDVAEVVEGDPCPECGKPLRIRRGLELGHIFLLGTRYSEPMRATFADQDGREKPIVMGCYGIGISRVMAALVEQNHDERGIKWNPEVAPFHLCLLCLNISDESIRKTAEELYTEAQAKGIEVLYDDREESPGFKFADADLVGIPYRIIVGRKVREGRVEIQSRLTGDRWDVPIREAVGRVARLLRETP